MAGRVLMTRERGFYRFFFSMFFVLVLQNVITISVNLADNVMIGRFSETALAGVSAVNQLQYTFQQVAVALGEGIVIIAAQYFGKKEFDPIRRVSSVAMHIALAAGTGLFLLATVCPRQVMLFFTTDEAIILQGLAYLRIIRWTYFFFSMTQILLATLRSMGEVRIALYLSLSTLAINAGINYILIFGKFGAPRLGVSGAAIGTLTARIAELGFLLLYIAKKKLPVRPSFRDYLRTDRVLRTDFVRVALPIVVVNGLWGVNIAVQNAILGHIADGALAANSVSSTLFMVMESGMVGACAAAAFVVGKTIGEGNMVRLKEYVRTMQVLFLLVGTAGGTALFFLRLPVLSLYHLEPSTRALANQFLILMSVICVTMTYEASTSMGIIRGGGDTSFTMKMDLICIWGICVPLALIGAFLLHLPPVWVLLCIKADQIYKCLPVFIKANYGHWAKKLTREGA